MTAKFLSFSESAGIIVTASINNFHTQRCYTVIKQLLTIWRRGRRSNFAHVRGVISEEGFSWFHIVCPRNWRNKIQSEPLRWMYEYNEFPNHRIQFMHSFNACKGKKRATDIMNKSATLHTIPVQRLIRSRIIPKRFCELNCVFRVRMVTFISSILANFVHDFWRTIDAIINQCTHVFNVHDMLRHPRLHGVYFFVITKLVPS